MPCGSVGCQQEPPRAQQHGEDLTGGGWVRLGVQCFASSIPTGAREEASHDRCLLSGRKVSSHKDLEKGCLFCEELSRS
jgi:hypothetical protein